MKLKIEVNEIDSRLLQELTTHTGFDEDTIFKIALRMYHKKELPQYVRKRKAGEQNADLEFRCKQMGGEFFVDEEGRKFCKVKSGGMEYTQAL